MELKELFEMQKELDKYILEKHDLKMSKEELLDNTILALLVEVGELANTTRCFKHWSTKGMMDKEVILEELADVWHFYLSIGNQTNVKILGYESTILLSGLGLSHAILEVYHSILAIDTDTENIWYEEEYQSLGYKIISLGKILGFTDEEVEQAYLKKHKKNYERQENGY